VHNTAGWVQLPPDFANGEHGTLCLNYDAEAWFAPPDGRSDRLAKRFLTAAGGKLSDDNVQSYLYDGDVVVGTTSTSNFRVLNFQGTIGVNPQGSGVFSTVVYFSREPVWADRSREEKMTVLLARAEKYVGPEARAFMQSLMPLIAQTAVVMTCLAGLGTLLGPVIALAIAAVIGVAFVLQRGDQYVEKFQAINAALNSTTVNESNANDRELEAAAQALAAFISMLVQDVVFAVGTKAAHGALVSLRNVLTNRTAKTVSTAANEVCVPTAQAGPGALSFEQIYLASGRGFKGMPSFAGKGYDALGNWLEANGFTKVKDAGLEQGTTLPGTRNSNKGGSEIWVRRNGPLRARGMVEAVRIDRFGHDPAFDQKGTGFTFPSNWVKLRGVAGAKAHFHKEVIAGDMESTYVQQFVKNKLDFNDLNTSVEVSGESYFRQIHVPLDLPPAGGSVQPGAYSTGRYGR
jgi:hypothetical protein